MILRRPSAAACRPKSARRRVFFFFGVFPRRLGTSRRASTPRASPGQLRHATPRQLRHAPTVRLLKMPGRLFGVANFYPRSAPDVRVSRNHVRRDFAVEDLCVPLVAYEIDTIHNGDHELRDGTEVDESGELMSDETGLALWPTSTLVVSVLMRCRGVLGATDVLELGSGSGFCGLVARQIANRVVFSDREFESRELIRRNLRLQPLSDMPASRVECFGWAEGDERPAERFGLVVASDVIYGAHEACCTCPHELRRFVDLLEWSLAPGGMVVIGHTERNCRARADLQEALRRHFLVRTLRADECISRDWCQSGNGAALRAATVLLCTRAGEAAAEALLAAAVGAEQAEPAAKPAAAEGAGELPSAPDVGRLGTDSASTTTRNAKRERCS
jgi:predicted nicotinamide N-methyase